MSSNKPTRLDEYCKAANLSFFDLQIPCLFCKFHLSLQELAGFHQKTLSLVWRDDQVYALCYKCTRLSAKFEFEKYLRCIVKCEYVDVLAECPLINLSVRCVDCYKLLDIAEKVDLKARDEDLYLVRRYWRGYCRECYKR